MKKAVSYIHVLSKFIAFVIRLLLRIRYRVTLVGFEKIKTDSSLLFLPNHPALIDPVILVSQLWRFIAVVPVISEKYYNVPMAKWYFKGIGAVSVSDLEAGSRNTQVLTTITGAVSKGFRQKKNIVIYPGGQIAGQGYERIFNKKSAYHIVKEIPEDVQVVGVRITGLWGSMWSKAKTGKSPNFFVQLLKGTFYVLAHLVFFVPKREVKIEFSDITSAAKENAVLGQKPFNQFLEEFYNVYGEEKAVFYSFRFLTGK
jgi:1-acyl-sn-glycerol-3-phosphate acyltransferase